MFEQVGLKVDEASSIKELLSLISKKHYDAILLDNYLGDHHLGVDSIPEILKASPVSKIIMLTAHASIDSAVKALNQGASGFLIKSDPLHINVHKFCEFLTPRTSPGYDISQFERLGIIGNSEAMQQIYSKLVKISPTDVTVLISGESGTGKELIARAIHHLSPRNENGPFIAINCAAIAESLLESELFGSKKGSYTGSSRDRKGYFETCHNGTLFLDEIGEMTPSLQAKLLRVLQEKEITPIGSCQPIRVNARVIAATNCNLLSDMKTGRFREDLFYRLSVLKIDVPPLRERLSDIPALVRHFVTKSNNRFNKSVKLPSCHLMAKLKAYAWPGNVRELHNAVERAVLLAETDEMHLEDLIPVRINEPQITNDTPDTKGRYPLDFTQAKEVFEKSYLEQLLFMTKGNIAEAARVSGQYRPAIYRLMKKFSIDINQFK